MEDSKRVELEIFAAELRKTALHMIACAGSGHVGGSMSAADLIAVLYGAQMRYRPQEPDWSMRDRLVMSKGHSGCIVYAALEKKGFFPVEWETTMNQLGTNLPSHCDRTKTPGIDMSSGSLGQGLSAAAGIAFANMLNGRDVYTYCVLGDGECQEGQVWEALMFCGYRRIPNLIAFIDRNGKQVDGELKDILPIDGIDAHARLFGWHTQTVDGNDVGQLMGAIDAAKRQSGPALIVMNTIKGKDCSFAEQLYFNHGISVSPEQLAEAERYLDEKIARIREGEAVCHTK